MKLHVQAAKEFWRRGTI